MIGLVKKNSRLMYQHLPDDWEDGDHDHVECKKAPPVLISAEMGILTDPKTGKQTVFATKYLARKEFFAEENEICQQCLKCVEYKK